jgi:hypothetical protein
VGNFKIAAATIAVNPAAGPLTLNCEPLNEPITIPPIIPEISPLNRGALEAKAMPKHKGKATKNTTIDDGKSLPKFFRYELARLIDNNFKKMNR